MDVLAGLIFFIIVCYIAAETLKQIKDEIDRHEK